MHAVNKMCAWNVHVCSAHFFDAAFIGRLCVLNNAVSVSVSQTKFGPASTSSSSTQNNWSPGRKMPPTITLADTTPSARRLSTWCWTVSESWLTSAPDCRDSSSSTRSGAARDPALRLCWWSACPWTTGKSPNWSFASTRRQRWDLNHWSIDWLISWLIDWLIDWLTDWLITWLIDCLDSVGVDCCRGAVQFHPDHSHHAGTLGLRFHGRQSGYFRHLSAQTGRGTTDLYKPQPAHQSDRLLHHGVTAFRRRSQRGLDWISDQFGKFFFRFSWEKIQWNASKNYVCILFGEPLVRWPEKWQSVKQSIIRSINRLIDWLSDGWMDWSIDWLIALSFDRLIDGWMHWLIDWLVCLHIFSYHIRTCMYHYWPICLASFRCLIHASIFHWCRTLRLFPQRKLSTSSYRWVIFSPLVKLLGLDRRLWYAFSQCIALLRHTLLLAGLTGVIFPFQGSRNHQCLLRAGQPNGQVRSPAGQIHGLLYVVPRRRGAQGRDGRDRGGQEQVEHSLRRLVSHRVQGDKRKNEICSLIYEFWLIACRLDGFYWLVHIQAIVRSIDWSIDWLIN